MQHKKVEDSELIALQEQGLNQAQIAECVGVSAMAVSKRLKKIRAQQAPASFEKLTDKQKVFVQELASGKNRTDAALAAFDCSSRDSAKALGSTLLKEPDIALSYADLLASEGLSRRTRVSKMAELLHSKDNAAVCKVLDMSFKLDGSMVEKVQHEFVTVEMLRSLTNAINVGPSEIEDADFAPV